MTNQTIGVVPTDPVANGHEATAAGSAHRVVEFRIYGKPATQGSKKAFGFRNKTGGISSRVVDNDPNLRDWRHAVAQEAAANFSGPLMTGPVALFIHFVRPRPKGHYRTGKRAGELRPSARKYPTGIPDTIKMARAVEDAMKGVIWRDDSQVVDHRLLKTYGDRFECHVKLWEMEE